jgi:lysophospholipase L1-like esterase
VCGIVKPVAESNSLMTTANKDIAKLAKKDILLISIDTNDLEVNNSKIALKNIRSYIERNNHTNIIPLEVPHRFDLTNSSHVTNEIKVFNNKLLKCIKPQIHTKILEIDHHKTLFTKHGLHLNGFGRELLAKRIASVIYSILEEKKTGLR